MGKLDGRVALITGAAQGQGEAAARRFVSLGAQVAVTDIDGERGAAVAADLGEAAVFLSLDVTSEADWEKTVSAVLEHFGRLDVLVNNAGIAVVAPLVDTSLELFRRMVDINQVGVFLGMRAVAPVMAPGGSIVNISSVEGLAGMPGLTAYVASKFAVRGMTKVAALELAPLGIRVNSVHPGVVDTRMAHDPGIESSGAMDRLLERVPMGRRAQPSEIADLVAFLASDESRYSTGAEFVADGGMTAGTFLSLG